MTATLGCTGSRHATSRNSEGDDKDDDDNGTSGNDNAVEMVSSTTARRSDTHVEDGVGLGSDSLELFLASKESSVGGSGLDIAGGGEGSGSAGEEGGKEKLHGGQEKVVDQVLS